MSLEDILPFFSPESATFSEEPRDIIHQIGDMASALLYSTIFFPEFIEVDDSILLKDNISDAEASFRHGAVESQSPLAVREASYNSIEVAYLFSTRGVSLDESEDSDTPEIKRAHIIADAWADRLKRLYPSRVFKVSVLTPEESGSVYSVEFYEVR
jgi:hypothetical protein